VTSGSRELSQGLGPLGCRHARQQRVLAGVVREPLLDVRAEQPGNEALGSRASAGGRRQANAGNVDQGSRVTGRSEGKLGAHGLGANLLGLLEPVVVIDQAQRHLAGVDRVEDEPVLLVGLHVIGDQSSQPFLGALLSLGQAHRRHEGLE
jgi:hypothetical protein